MYINSFILDRGFCVNPVNTCSTGFVSINNVLKGRNSCSGWSGPFYLFGVELLGFRSVITPSPFKILITLSLCVGVSMNPWFLLPILLFPEGRSLHRSHPIAPDCCLLIAHTHKISTSYLLQFAHHLPSAMSWFAVQSLDVYKLLFTFDRCNHPIH